MTTRISRSQLAYAIMHEATRRRPNSNWARAATERWFHLCEQELERANELLRAHTDQNRKENL